MREKQRRAKALKVGDCFSWCGMAVRLLDHHPEGPGRWLECQLPTGERRPLYYRDDEFVTLTREVPHG